MPHVVYGFILSLYPDARQRLRLLSQDWVAEWQVWSDVARDLQIASMPNDDCIAGLCVIRVTRIVVGTVSVNYQSDAERKQALLGNCARVATGYVGIQCVSCI